MLRQQRSQLRTPSSSGRVGLSLIELLIAIAICAVLLSLLLGAVQRARATAVRAACANNLRQLALGTHGHSAQAGLLPQGCAYPFATAASPRTAQAGISWQTAILPYIEQGDLWQRAWRANQTDPVGYSSAHMAIRETVVRLFLCPAESESRRVSHMGVSGTWATTSYVGVAGTSKYANDGLFHVNFSIRLTDITDGTANTLLLGERPPGPAGRFGGWYANWGDCTCPIAQILAVGPRSVVAEDGSLCPLTPGLAPGRLDELCSVEHFWSLHPVGALLAFADGSVRFINYSAAPLLLSLATRAGGEAETVPE
ncbi:DUF1559 domain-containing protein [Gemmata algarum]|uniref:DUF1559 family PulG-like putative transporter n=1 Tax=Gemmata algarum TaxID=2975278 RepID=UPI0039C90599